MNPPNFIVRVSIILSTLTFWIFFSSNEDTFALIYPAWAPPNETVWGKYRLFFDNIFQWCPSVGDVITGFSSVGVPICITPSVTWLDLPGDLGYTLYHNGVTWVSSPNIYNANSNVGIGTIAPWAKLEVAGQIKITGGAPGPGKILMSDATGLASWSAVSSSFSWAYWSLTGNTITATDFIGSLNPEDLVFKTNNIEKMRISDADGDIFIGTMRVGNGATNDIESVAIGRSNGTYGGNGLRNTSVGTFALQTVGSGSYNSAFGYGAMQSASWGNYNTALGAWASWYYAYGSNNTSVGTFSYYYGNTSATASDNTVVWSNAMKDNRLWSSNTIVWSSAGWNYTAPTTNYSNSSFFGYRAGNVIGTGTNNILLWYQAADTLTTGSNNIVLGFNVDTPTPTSNNTLNIGNIIFGNGIDGANTTLSTGNIGIGVANPSAKLEIAWQIKITGGTPGLGKYLASDASWLATWSTVSAGNMSGSFWSLSGNTIGDNDYLGTNNAKSLVFKSNALERLRITSVGNIAWLDYGSSLGGTNSLAIGLNAGTSMNGSYDTALGWYGAWYQMGWIYNVAFWWAYAGYAMGWSSNVAIGTYAGTGMSSGNNNIYIGSYAIGNMNQDNQFSIGNIIYGSGMGANGLTNGRIGIGTRTPGQKLTISWGTIQILYGAYGSWKVLVSDTNGVAFWWDTVTGTASSVSATGIVNGVANYVPKFWSGWVGLVPWLLYDNDQTLWVGTITPTAGYVLHASGSLLIGDDTVFPDMLNESFESATFPPAGWTTVASGGIMITRDTTTGSSGSASVKFNGNGANAQNASISYTVTVTSNSFLSFYWKASSEPGGDILSFCLDSTPCTINTSGITPWTKVTYNLSPWVHTLKWKYEKDGAFANGADAVWIDQINIRRYGPTYFVWGHIGVGIPTPQFPLDVEGYIQSHGYCITGLCANTWRWIMEQWTTAPGYNGFVWVSSLWMLTTGNFNIAFWPFALAQTTSGVGNTAVGTQSQFANNIGSNNSSVGFGSLYTNKWVNNTAMGTRALNTNITGNNNIALGYQSAQALTSGSNNIVIGYDIDLPSIASSNMLNIGNLIYATGLNGINTILSTGNVGIGTATPGAKLTISGSVQITDGTQGVGRFLVSDASGIGSWQSTSSVLAWTYWSLSGNTVGINDYIGSNNVQDLILKTNGIEKFRIFPSMNSSGQIASLIGGDIVMNGITTGLGRWQIITNTVFWTDSLRSNTTWYENTANGYTALSSNTTWYNNIAIGSYALQNSRSWYENTANWSYALTANTTGYANSAVWAFALTSNTTWISNTAIGHASMISNTTWVWNTALGKYSLQSNTIGSENTALWYGAMSFNTTWGRNIAIWQSALGTNSIWSYNTANWYQALSNWSSGSYNTALWHKALLGNIGIGNIGIGSGSAYNLTNWSNNIAIWSNTSFSSWTASNQLNIGNWIYGDNGNIGIGTSSPWQRLTISWGTIQIVDGTQWSGKVLVSDASGIASWSAVALSASASWITGWSGFYIPKFGTGWNGLVSSLFYDNGTSLGLGTTSATSRFEIWSGATSYFHMRGVNNIGFGIGSVRPALTGNANSGYGHESLYTLTSGYSNSAYGYQSLRFTTTGYNNSALWQESLYNNNDGTWNTGIGYQSLRSGTSTDYNVALWAQSLYSLGVWSGNVAIGNNALYGATTTASNNTALGYLAGSGITTGWNNITIGYNTQIASWAASNQLNIGNWIYGNGGKISIGQTNVGSGIYALDVEWGYINSSSWLCINDTCLSNWSNIFNAISGSGNAIPKWNAAGTGLVASRIIENGTDILISTGSLQSVNITPANSNQYSQVLISSGWALKQWLTSREKLRIFAVSNYWGSAVQSLCMYNSSNAACGGMGSPAYTNVPNYNQVDAISYTGWIWDYIPATSVSKAPYFVSFYTGTYMVTTSYTFEAGSLTSLSWGCNFFPYYSVYSNTGAVPVLRKYTAGTDVIFTMDFSTVLSNVDSSTNLNVPDRRTKRVGMQFIQNVFMTPGQALVMTLWFQDPGDACIWVTDRWVDLVTNSQKKQTLSIVEL